MALSSGSKLGPYEILAPIGAGGMGEVYRANDTRLDRVVAIKILPDHLAEFSNAKQRFDREARAISSLNHPHICVLHDVGSENGTSYIVMEFVQGESLEARLQRGPLPLKQALECGVQICDALEKAHRAGIVHRDLKPGNIMLSAAGAKLLDFGLAKPVPTMIGAQSSATGHLTPSTPTMNLSAMAAPAKALTQQGAIVGTFQFIAPEVLQGKEADARSDIFSFGCVLYEMLSGRRAFEGKSQLSVMSAILEKEPEPISKVQPLLPLAIDHVIQDCLAKEPEARWQSAADVGKQLRWIANSGSSVTAAPGVAKRNRLNERLLWAALVLLLVAGVAWLALRVPEAPRVVRSYLPPPPETGFDFNGDFSGPPAINPDGTAVVFCARKAHERSSLWVQSLSELGARKLEGTEGAAFPFWSPDGKSVGFFSDAHLKKIPADGGPVTILAEAPNARGGSWNQDNVIIFEPDYRNVLWKISASGGTSAPVTKMEAQKHTTHRWPQFMPDGKHFVFFATNHSGTTEQAIYFGSLADGTYKKVLDSDAGAQYASGYLLYHLQSQLMAVKFNPSSGVASGDPLPVASFAEYDPGTWHSSFTASQNGLLIYEPGAKTQGVGLVWMDRTGKELGKIVGQGAFKGSGQISPDGKRLAIAEGDPQGDIWVIDLATGSRTRLTFGGATHLSPSWSPDGKKVLYVRQEGSTLLSGTSLCQRPAAGGGQEEVLLAGSDVHPENTAGPASLLMPQFSPDGRYLLHIEQTGPTGSAVWALSLAGDKKLTAIVRPQTPLARVVQYGLSPDGKWLAFTSTDSGREEVYVTRFPSGEGRWQVSQTAGTFPVWRSDGKEIYFAGLSDGMFRAAPVSTAGEEFQVEEARALFSIAFTSPLGTPFQPAKDGQRFLIATYPEATPTPLVMVSNWTAELKK